ncbi:MAG: Trm112 family protein [Hyphomicrobium sp.]|nr:Trm112 family protein [Hyphomicrobium sp.]
MSGNERYGEPSAGPRLDPRLLEVLVCPLTKAILVYSPEKQELLSRKAALAYPIRNGVPLMTAEAARHLTDEEIDKL